MIEKYRVVPDQIIKEIALSRRLPLNHYLQPTLKSSINIGKAGYKGEKEVDYYLELLPNDKFRIFQGIRLPRDSYFFQMDNLILLPEFILIIEVKNIEGTLFFDQEHNQFYRISRLTKERQKMNDPFKQVKRHRKQLFQWMAKHGFPLVPIEYLVVNTNEDTLFDSSGNQHDMFEKIIHSEYLLEKVYKLEQKYQKEYLNDKDLRKLSKQLLKADTPLIFDIRQFYKFDDADLIKGVRCPQCNTVPMTWYKRAWQCDKCKHRSKDAHKPALHDFFLLISPATTNLKCREFLKCDSTDTIRYLLKSMNFKTKGIKKGMQYTLSFPPSQILK
ncbi:nuclease-like protein [Bacillus oleivorans]|uniref:Nuclease-like protein n=1 Tax=Bacillus oleivorans TaxID=1448271 RepID=A0A285CHP7_9BACI|nr:nuclease-related domain-containing protein [Bacillus oleivorans]SNX67029.1 nuclease-like protein [Bacillus oleivorans]